MEKYAAIVRSKTAYYSFYLPVVLGLMVAGWSGNSTSLASAETILIKMGEYFQIQDDYLDCFGDPDVIGKIGTDIEDHKCSWLVVQALQLVNASQMMILKVHAVVMHVSFSQCSHILCANDRSTMAKMSPSLWHKSSHCTWSLVFLKPMSGYVIRLKRKLQT